MSKVKVCENFSITEGLKASEDLMFFNWEVLGFTGTGEICPDDQQEVYEWEINSD